MTAKYDNQDGRIRDRARKALKIACDFLYCLCLSALCLYMYLNWPK